MLGVIGWRKDAEAAGRFVIDHIRTKKKRTEMSADVLAWVARWAGHWGRKELARLEQSSALLNMKQGDE